MSNEKAIICNLEMRSSKVDHTYSDYSKVTEEEAALSLQKIRSGDQLITGSAPHGNVSEQNFPVKLHYMLCEIEADGLENIASWQPHGRCFLVHKLNEFVEQILPFWFRQTKFASFQRQLNIYGFHRITVGPDKYAYYHELFLRGKPFLTHRIERSKIKGQGPRKPSSPETEPEFYTMPFLPSSKACARQAILKQRAWPLARSSNVGGNLGFPRAILSSPEVPVASSMQAFAQQMTSTHRLNVEERPSSLACLALRLVTQKDNVPRDSHTETAAAVMRMRLAMALDAASRERSLAQAVLVQSRLLHHETSLAAFVLQQNYHQLRNGEDPRFTAYLPL